MGHHVQHDCDDEESQALVAQEHLDQKHGDEADGEEAGGPQCEHVHEPGRELGGSHGLGADVAGLGEGDVAHRAAEHLRHHDGGEVQAHGRTGGDLGLARPALAQLGEVDGVDEHGEQDYAGDLVEELRHGHGGQERGGVGANEHQAKM